MKGFVLPIAAIAVAGLFLPTGANPAYAACAPFVLEEQVQKADFIITGTVSQVGFNPPLDEESPDDLVHTLQVVFAVDEYLKGSGPDTLTIPEPTIRRQFEEDGILESWGEDGVFDQDSAGKRYILFLRGELDSLTTNACLGSGSLDGWHSPEFVQDVRSAIADANALPPTGSAPAADQPGEGTPWLPIIGASLGLTLLADGGWLTLRAWRGA